MKAEEWAGRSPAFGLHSDCSGDEYTAFLRQVQADAVAQARELAYSDTQIESALDDLEDWIKSGQEGTWEHWIHRKRTPPF